jgi:protoheme ferro-lyase
MYETVKRLAAEHRTHVAVVPISPISLVSDHVETLHEIAIEHYEKARRLWIEDLHMVPGSTNTRSARASAGAEEDQRRTSGLVKSRAQG